MKVKELKEALASLPDDMEVVSMVDVSPEFGQMLDGARVCTTEGGSALVLWSDRHTGCVNLTQDAVTGEMFNLNEEA